MVKNKEMEEKQGEPLPKRLQKFAVYLSFMAAMIVSKGKIIFFYNILWIFAYNCYFL